MNTRLFSTMLLTVLAAEVSFAQGFTGHYSTSVGDFDFDGRTDLLITEETRLLIVPADIAIPIVLPPSVPPLILKRNADATYSIVAGEQDIDWPGWGETGIEVHVTDFNFDGTVDLQLTNLTQIDATAVDQVILASKAPSTLPFRAIALTDDVIQFQREVISWAYDPEFFEENAPEIAVQQPPTAQWFGAVFNPADYFSLNLLLARCEIATGNECGASFEPPDVCIVVVDVFDSSGRFLGTDTINVCVIGAIHVYVFIPGTVEFIKDYSVFNQNALEFVDAILSISPNGIDGLRFLDQEILDSIDPVLTSILIDLLRGLFKDDDEPSVFRCDKFNSFSHAAFPGDGELDESDPTFHHYDAESFVCDISENGCSDTVLNDDLLRLFSYPSKELEPTMTELDGLTPYEVYVAPPWAVDDPEDYDIFFGYITQTVLPSGEWAGAIENTTLPAHVVYPGKIFRTITNGRSGASDRKHIFTHGIGLNNFLWPDQASFPGPLNIVLACANDIFGKEAFETLDRVAIEYWRDEVSQSGSGKPQPPPQPAFLIKGQQ